ncbi:MAG TPA: L,D-transpeptidase family protein [Bryobacteraceae bacterium]|nr:L,D-transpeptidase family protein [Bryobacteraceae bacterium]
MCEIETESKLERRIISARWPLWLLIAGTLVNSASAQQNGASDVSSQLRGIASAGQLPDLRWPNFVDYRAHVQNFYQPSDFTPAWVRNGQPTPQALAIINLLKQADTQGLDPEDYDGSRWADRLARLQNAHEAGPGVIFDAALTVCLMRYISDRHIGRINPEHFKFGLDVEEKKYDLPAFLRERLVNGPDVTAELAQIGPPFAGYNRTLQALQRYMQLAPQDDGEKLPDSKKPIAPGDSYDGIPRLTRLLRLLGDLPANAAIPADSKVYQGALVDGVKSFQNRHGLKPDGRLDEQTLKHLNTPVSQRVDQLRLTLERWRWLPDRFNEPRIVVNIPEFRLRAYDDSGNPALSMDVIVGKAFHHKTPIFEKDMRFVVFRPYWNVPPSIQRSEIVPAIQKDRDYISKKGFEVVTPAGQVVTSGAITDEVLAQLRAGKLEVRQKPGTTNALGLVKLMFPNEYNVYLHSTPAPQLFSQTRRDFSHGCIRVEHPADLAAWVLRDKPDWNVQRAQTAMQTGKDNDQVNLTKPIPVLILYATAIVDPNGEVHFFDDVYGYDDELRQALVQGYPYPG